jgi:hypothetical protein
MLLGIMATINSNIDYETAELIASEFEITLELKMDKTYEEKLIESAESVDDETLLVSIRPIQTVGKRNMVFNFRRNDKVVMTPSSTPYVGDILATLDGFFDQMIPNKAICTAFKKLVQFLPPLVEPKHYGKFIEGIKKR